MSAPTEEPGAVFRSLHGILCWHGLPQNDVSLSLSEASAPHGVRLRGSISCSHTTAVDVTTYRRISEPAWSLDLLPPPNEPTFSPTLQCGSCGMTARTADIAIK